MALFDVENNVYTALKKAFVVESGKYVPLKYAFVVEGGKYVKIWSGGIPGTYIVSCTRGGYFAKSKDGKTWTFWIPKFANTGSNIGSSTYWTKFYYDFSSGVLLAPSGTQQVVYSLDNFTTITTKSVVSGTSVTYKVAHGNDMFVMTPGASRSDTSHYSADGITWTKGSQYLTSPGTEFLGYANGLYILFGKSAGFYSTDGNSWTKIGVTNELVWYQKVIVGLVYAFDKYIAVASTGEIYYSTNATSWTLSHTLSGSPTITGIETDGSVVVMVGNSGYIAYLDKNMNSQVVDGITVMDLYCVQFGDRFIVGGTNSRCLVSSNGKTWTENVISSDLSLSLRGMGFIPDEK